MNYSKYLLFVLLFLILLTPLSAADNTVKLKDEPLITLDQGQLSFYRDKSGLLKLEDVKKTRSEGQFERLNANLSIGYTPDAIWLYFSLQREVNHAVSWILEVVPVNLDNIQVFHLSSGDSSSGETIDFRQGGDFVPQSGKELSYRGSVFKLELTEGYHEFYIRLKTSSTMVAAIKLWQNNSFIEYLSHNYFYFGLYFSLIFTVLIFNLLNYSLSGKKIFLIYFFYMSFNLLQMLGVNGFIAEFIFPEHPLLANVFFGVTLSLAIAMGFYFFMVLFELKKYHRNIYWFYIFGTIFAIVTAIATPLGYYRVFAPWILLLLILGFALAPFILIRLWRTKKRWNRYVVIAYLAFELLIMSKIFSSLGLLPFTEAYTYTSMAGNIFHLFILQAALMEQYREIEKEHTKAIETAFLIEKQMQLEQKNHEELSELLTMITHEIRTPISVIDAANESLRLIDEKMDEASVGNNRVNRYQRIQKAVKRMNMVMNIAMTQKELGNIPFEAKILDYTWLTHEVIELCGAHAVKRVVIENQEQDIIIEADHSLMRIALLNLIDNALKYSPENSPVFIDIKKQEKAGQDGVVWIIKDQGPGIPQDKHSQIFKKFMRVDATSQHEGMGLGLFLVAQIVEKHRGTIDVKNNAESGAMFSLWLPNKQAKS